MTNMAEKPIDTVGFARLDITPPLGVVIGGSFTARVTKGVIDPLQVNAVAFGAGEKAAVVLVCDLLKLAGEPGEQWPDRLAGELGLEAGSVLIHCTHAHTTPDVGSDLQYDQWLYRRLHDAARLALDDRAPVDDVQWAEGQTHGIVFVRRYWMKDGTVLTNPRYADPELVRPACENDESIRLIRILRRDGKEIALVNFQNHPDCIGGEFISGDFPSQVRRTVEGARDVHCVYLNGAQGQMVPNDKTKPRTVLDGQAKAEDVGERTGQAALELFDKTASTGMTGLSFARRSVELKTKRDPARVPEAERIVALRKAGRSDEEICPTPGLSDFMRKKMANYIVAESKHLCRLEQEKLDFVRATVTVLHFCGLALVGFPGEPFNEVGKYVRAHSKFPATCACCLTNGSMGYFPMEQDYELGGYESFNSPLVKGTTEQLMHLGEQLLASL